MNLHLYLTIIASTFICKVNSKKYSKSDDYYDYYNYESGDNSETPTFLSRSQTFTVEVGQSVIFPCQVKNQGKHVLIIKREKASRKEQLLAVGGIKVIHTPRLVADDHRLTIKHVWPRDAGEYVCSFASVQDVTLRHTLNVQFSPSISASVPTHHRVPKGSSVELECQAEGNPTPSIRWSRQEGPLPSGTLSSEGTTLKLNKVDRNEEGSYVCTADNGIGEPSSAVITVVVEYPPEIVTEKAIVRTGEGDQVDLVCLVRGRPSPQVSWTRDGHPVAHNAHVSDFQGSHRHTLSITSVSEKDFGAYVCIAENSQGQESAVIQMTGLPRQPHITSPHTGGESHTYTISFETESFYTITEYRILHRRAQANLSASVPGSWQDLSRRVTMKNKSERNREASHLLEHRLEDLDGATDYEVVVRVRNKYGWSSDSEMFPFSTGKAALAVQQSFSDFFFNSGSSSTIPCVQNYFYILLVTILMRFYVH